MRLSAGHGRLRSLEMGSSNVSISLSVLLVATHPGQMSEARASWLTKSGRLFRIKDSDYLWSPYLYKITARRDGTPYTRTSNGFS